MKIDDFINKKILIFCPHEDDEINLAGGLLLELKKIECEVKVIYSTNGDWFINAKYRINEAMKGLKKLGVSKDKIIFLGYPDCFSSYKNHLYMSNENWISPKGMKETYLPKGEEYHYKKHKKHAIFNKENFIIDIFEIMEEEMADILICVDYDDHADHRALHLSFEKAMGRILNQYKDYSPIVLKAFAYPTAYTGVKDFKNHKLLRTKFMKSKISLYDCQNPYYKWENRVSIDVSKSVKNKFLLFNPLFIAMTKHISQAMYKVAYQVINSDQVFFERRTDNLLYSAHLKISSGNAEVLRDFMRFDSSDIMKGDIVPEILDLGFMKFNKEDKKKSIQIIFDEKVDVEEINLYQYVNCNTKLEKIKLIIDDKEKKYDIEIKDYCYQLKNLDFKQIQKLEIVFEKDDEIELTEVEIFSNSRKYSNVLKEEEIKNTLLDKMIFKLNDLVFFMYRCITKIWYTLFFRKGD